jgi:alcohol dehydrogenase class IV/protocatechuate 3,4-dioxygenase beta subunit
VVFGSGTVAAVGSEVALLGARRVMLLSTPQLEKTSRAVRESLGPLLAAEYDGAAMHTPVEVTERALEALRASGAECLVAVGGGSTTGLSKALAFRTGLPQVVLPTTYAGSEATPVLGETENGRKVTHSSRVILPSTIIYDVDFTLDLPTGLTVCSAVNAMAHAVEALYSPQANPVTDGMALDAIGRIAATLPMVALDPRDREARASLLQAAWLAGVCLGTVGMGLHHKLCHVLGGSLGLPHAETHTVVLSHVMAYNAPAVPGVMARIAAALGAADAPAGVFSLIERAGGPVSLRQLGMAEEEIGRVAREVTASPYPNPREPDTDGIEELLRSAWRGERPRAGDRAVPDVSWLTDQVADSFAGARDPRLRRLMTRLVRDLHRFVAENDVTQPEWQRGIDFLTETGQLCDASRQEFVLLSDVLGVSSVVDVLSNSRTPETTPSAVLGPFYVAGPPAREHGADIATGLAGTPTWVDVSVEGPDGKAVAGATVDVWQSNDDGFYDVQLPDLEGPVLRARFTTDDEGRLAFWSILPSEYPIPDDGPVGQMLAATGRHPWRAPHLHFLITAPGYRQLITQLFVAGGRYLDSDTVFGVKEDLIVDFTPQHGPTPDGRETSGEWRLLRFTFRVATA